MEAAGSGKWEPELVAGGCPRTRFRCFSGNFPIYQFSPVVYPRCAIYFLDSSGEKRRVLGLSSAFILSGQSKTSFQQLRRRPALGLPTAMRLP